MPYEKTRVSGLTNAGGLTLDRRQALTIAPMGKLDSCRTANPLRILKRNSLSDESADVEVAAGTPKCPKIHWTQLASKGASSPAVPCRNGRQASGANQNTTSWPDINRRQVKVMLMDVLQTEAGRRYLSNSGSSSISRPRSLESQRGGRERRSEGLVQPTNRGRRRASPARTGPTNSSAGKAVASPPSKPTRLADFETKDARSPLSKRLKQTNSSLKRTQSDDSDETESLELSSVHVPSAAALMSPSLKLNKVCRAAVADSLKLSSGGALQPKVTDSVDEELVGAKQTSKCQFLERSWDPFQDKSSEEFAVDVELEEEEKNEEKDEEPDQQNGEVVMGSQGEARGSVLRLSSAPFGGQAAEGEEPCEHSRQAMSASEHIASEQSKPRPSEPIVLSSEEEEDDEEGGGPANLRTLEGAKDPLTPHGFSLALERKKTPDPHNHTEASSFVDPTLSGSPVMELPFSALYMAGLESLCGGIAKITKDFISILSKDASGLETKASVLMAHVRKYSVWDGLVDQDCGLVKENEVPPASLLLFWLSEAQARRLSSDLSSVVQSGTRPAEGGTCVLLCLCEPLNGIDGALLASIMDIVGLQHGTTELLSPLTASDSLKHLQSGRETRLLQLLRPKTDTNEAAASPASSGAAANAAKDSDVRPNVVYTLQHRRAHGSYAVSVAPKPGAEWIPYRHQGPARRLIQFPPPPSKGAITVSTEDLECLDSGEFLNDVIIDFYLKYLLVEKAPRASVERAHVFSSFFYKQLTRRDNANEDSTSTPAQLRRHQRVRTWTRHVDIFEKDFLFVPVNQEAHWYLVVVCFPGLEEPQCVDREGQGSAQDGSESSSDSVPGNECQESQKSNGDGDRGQDESSSRIVVAPVPPDCTESTCKRRTVCKRPCILIMDSLKLSVHERIFKLLREYLQVEWEVKRGGQRDFSAERMVGSHCRVPLQDNSSDCGLYLLQYAESFLQDPVVHFDLPLRLERWFPRQQVREKRQEIRDLVLHLYRFQQGSLGHDTLEDTTEIVNAVQ